ncbi:hypothetical protein WMY93_033799, partial [Mugilogobius chulae]
HVLDVGQDCGEHVLDWRRCSCHLREVRGQAFVRVGARRVLCSRSTGKQEETISESGIKQHKLLQSWIRWKEKRKREERKREGQVRGEEEREDGTEERKKKER